jgi:hypothetical protein
LHIGGRAADDVEHIAGRGLVFEQFFEVARAGLQFAEQPRILHRNDRLVGKGAHQFDLPLSKRCNLPAAQGERADHRTVTQQWHAEVSPHFSERHRFGEAPVAVCRDVRDAHDLTGKGDPAGQCFAAGGKSPRPQEGVKGRVKRARGDIAEHVALADR